MVIGECHSGQIGDEDAAKYKKVNNSQDRELFIEFCLHTMLYQQGSQRYGIRFILNGACDICFGILNVIQAMEHDPELVYPLYLAASVHRSSEEHVVKRGEELLKKKTTGANLNDLNLIKRLFLLFNGKLLHFC
ncbi:hypothetical protein P8452_75807 [Trifolium repens]|nr:hypothetical protein P8452_75807 [Trifolium repens]